jgi:hypothetical protein
MDLWPGPHKIELIPANAKPIVIDAYTVAAEYYVTYDSDKNVLEWDGEYTVKPGETVRVGYDKPNRR